MIFTAFYQSAAGAISQHPMSLPDTIDYIWLGQALFVLLPWTTDSDIRQMIRSGNVAYELVRPVDLYGQWFCRSLATRTAPALLRALPMMAVAIPLLGLRPPASPESGIAFMLSVIGAALLAASITTLMSISLLWTLSGEGITRAAPILVLAFSGLIIPLPLAPNWLQPLLDFLPFRGIADAPFRLYTGHISATQAGTVLIHQLAWTAVLALIGRHVLARGIRRMVVQGG
jgi:ABC-2 type transport system permease protein